MRQRGKLLRRHPPHALVLEASDRNGFVSGSFQGTQFPYLYGGTSTFFLQAYGTGGVLYHSNLVTPPTATVINGQFPQLDSATPTTLLTL